MPGRDEGDVSDFGFLENILGANEDLLLFTAVNNTVDSELGITEDGKLF
jgi:hypothetical protein